MNPIKSFAIFKNNKKEKESHPDYTISAKVGEGYVTIGGAWIKEGKSGKFFSCKLSNTYEKRKGYSLLEDFTTEELELAKHDAKAVTKGVPLPEGMNYPSEINPNEIPF